MASPLAAKRVEFTQHAVTVMAERGISPEWVNRALAAPEWTENDPADPICSAHFAVFRSSTTGCCERYIVKVAQNDAS